MSEAQAMANRRVETDGRPAGRRGHRLLHAAAAVPAAIAVGLAAWAYIVEETGVDGTLGALLALIGAACVTLGAVLAALPALRGGLLTMLEVLLLVGALLTALAAYFLMQFLMSALMLVAVAMVVAAMSVRRGAAS